MGGGGDLWAWGHGPSFPAIDGFFLDLSYKLPAINFKDYKKENIKKKNIGVIILSGI